MAGIGPPPKPADQRRRRNATVAMTRLPAEGRAGDPPDFPLPAPIATRRGDDGDDGLAAILAEREAVLWRELWTTPQAVMWERSRSVLSVARFVRFSALAELGDLKAATEARQLEDRLGLNPQAMLRLRWEVAADEVGEQRTQRTTDRRTSAKARLKIVDSDAVAGP